MDNQFYQPGGMPPQGTAEQPGAGYAPTGYPGTQAPPAAPVNPYDLLNAQQANPYVVQPGAYGQMQSWGAPGEQPNPYEQLNPGASPYGAPADPYGQVPQGTSSYGVPGEPYGQIPPQDPAAGTAQQPPYGGVQHPYQDPGAMQQPYSDDGYQHLFNAGQPGQEQGSPLPKVQGRGQPFAGAAAPATPAGKKRLNPSDIALIVVAVLAVIGFAGWYLYATYAPEAARFGQVATGSLSAIHSGSVLVVRNEIPYDAEAVNSVVYEAEEGSHISRNDVICYVYSTGYSASAVRQLQEYRDEIRDYQRTLIEKSAIPDARTDRYNAELLTLALEIRAVMSGDEGSLPNIETQLTEVVTDRQRYLDQQYASDQRFSRMKDDERSQTQRISSWKLAYRATTDALISFYSDGYEYVINGSNYTTFEPVQVRAMINGVKPEGAVAGKGRTTIYRMVKDNEWYALFLSDDTDWNPVKGETYELQLERFGDTPVTATVVDFTKVDGELLVRLRIIGSVEQVMYLRSCDAVLSESMTTLMVNERAIYLQDEMTGVVVVEGSTESFIPVNVLHTVDGYAYFQTVQQGLLFEGMTVRLFD